METEISVSPSNATELRPIQEYRADRAGVNEACDTSEIAEAAVLAGLE